MNFWRSKKKAAKTNNEKGVYEFKNNALQVRCSVWFERLDPTVKRRFNEIAYNAHKEFYYSTVLELQEIVFKLQYEKNAFKNYSLEYDIIIDFILDGKFPDAYALPGEVVFRRGHKMIDCGGFYVDLSDMAKISTYGLDTEDYNIALKLNNMIDSEQISIYDAVKYMKDVNNSKMGIPSGIAEKYPKELFSNCVTSMSNLDGDLTGRVYFHDNEAQKFKEASKKITLKEYNGFDNFNFEKQLKEVKEKIHELYDIEVYDLCLIGAFKEKNIYNFMVAVISSKITFDVRISDRITTVKMLKDEAKLSKVELKDAEHEILETIKEEEKAEKEDKDMTVTNDEFINKAKAYINAKMGVDKSKIFVVWSSKTLQNHKALLSFYGQHELGDYIEATYNGDKKETYYDIYKKSSNEAIKDSGEFNSDGDDRDELTKAKSDIKSKLKREYDELDEKIHKLSKTINKGNDADIISLLTMFKEVTNDPQTYLVYMHNQLSAMKQYRHELYNRINLMNK